MMEILGLFALGAGVSLVVAVVFVAMMASADRRDLRRYRIIEPYRDNLVVGHAWTLAGAIAIARRRRGSRITDTYRHWVIRRHGSWSEARNGYHGERLCARELSELLGMPEDQLEHALADAPRSGEMRIGPNEWAPTYRVSEALRALRIDNPRVFI